MPGQQLRRLMHGVYGLYPQEFTIYTNFRLHALVRYVNHLEYSPNTLKHKLTHIAQDAHWITQCTHALSLISHQFTHLLWFDLLHDTHSLNDQSDSMGRPLQSPDLHHITLVEGLQAGQSGVLPERGGGEKEREREGKEVMAAYTVMCAYIYT